MDHGRGSTVRDTLERRHRLLESGEVTLKIIEAGEGPLVILLHGFGTTSHTWRKVMPGFVTAGYRVIAADLRGFGHSSCPPQVSAYGAARYNADLLAILGYAEAEQAVVVGHDHGSFHAWNFVQMHPERVAGIVSLGPVPLYHWAEPPTKLARKMFQPGRFMHVLYFQEVGPPEDELSSDIRQNLLRLFTASREEMWVRRPMEAGFLAHMTPRTELPPWLTEDDLRTYTLHYQRSGFFGGLCFYRNLDANWHELRPYQTKAVEAPALLIAGDLDPGMWERARDEFEKMVEWVPNLTAAEILPGIGHFVQEQAPEHVGTAILEFMGNLSPWK